MDYASAHRVNQKCENINAKNMLHTPQGISVQDNYLVQAKLIYSNCLTIHIDFFTFPGLDHQLKIKFRNVYQNNILSFSKVKNLILSISQVSNLYQPAKSNIAKLSPSLNSTQLS